MSMGNSLKEMIIQGVPGMPGVGFKGLLKKNTALKGIKKPGRTPDDPARRHLGPVVSGGQTSASSFFQ